MLTSDVESESDGTTLWDPATGPAQVLVSDPFGGPDACGSYFVFRKLEQNVKAFKTREQDLATAMGLTGDARELAGALVVAPRLKPLRAQHQQCFAYQRQISEPSGQTKRLFQQGQARLVAALAQPAPRPE